MREQIAQENAMGRQLRANVLGPFCLTDGVSSLTHHKIHSTMLSRLLLYFLCHRKRSLSAQELLDHLWADKQSERSAGALKNLVYRLRTLLCKTFDRNDFISTGRGFYSWNREIPLTLDYEEFDLCCARGSDQSLHDTVRMAEYGRAVEIYHGDFAEEQPEMLWTAPYRTQYHALYLQMVQDYLKLLDTHQAFEEISHVCALAIAVDPLDEALHTHKICALIQQGKKAAALERYNAYTKLLYEQLGGQPSEKLLSIYQKVTLQENLIEMDLGNIQRDLAESAALQGAFIADYVTFREIYRLQIRSMNRLGISSHIVLLTCMVSSTVAPDSDRFFSLSQYAMSQLEEVLKEALRRGDVATRYSGTQYVLLLPSCTHETGTMIAQRVMDRFRQKNTKQDVTVQYRLAKLETVGS